MRTIPNLIGALLGAGVCISTLLAAETVLYFQDFEDPGKVTPANFGWLEFRGGNPSTPTLNALGVSTTGDRNLFLNVNTTAATTSWFAGLRHVYDAPLPTVDLSRLSLSARVGGGGTVGPIGDVFLRIESSANNWVGFRVSGEALAANPAALIATGGLLSEPTATVGSFDPAAERFNIVLAFGNTLTTWGNDASNVIRLDDVRLVWLNEEPGSGYAGWLAANLTPGELEQPERVDPAADPGGFGIPNLLRYAFDLDPRTPALDGGPFLDLVPQGGDHQLSLAYTRRLNQADLTYTVLASNDLVTWSPLPENALHEVEPRDAATETVIYHDPVLLSGAASRFLRLSVLLTEPTP